MNKIKLFFVTVVAIGLMTLSSYAAMTIDWQDSTANIVTEDNMRCIAYNPATNHLLMAVSDGSSRGIAIIDPTNGTVLGSIATTTTTWDGNVPSPYGIAVDANGVIYATKGFYSSTSPIEILRWTDELAAEPTSCVTTDANMVRSLRVVGTGTNTKLVMSAQGDEPNIIRIYGTTDSLNFSLETSFSAPSSAHDALPNAALDVIYVTRAFNGTTPNETHKWIKTIDGWVEDVSWVPTPWIMELALSESAGKLYGVIWDMALQPDPPITEGIRVFDATSGFATDTLDIGESGGSSKGCYIAIHEANTVDLEPKSVMLPPGQTRTLVMSADLSRKLYYAICGLVGYGRIDLGAVITGPVWSSNNYAVASVDNTGVVHSLTVGVCTVSATYTRDAVPFTDSAEISVVATSAPLVPEATSYNKIHRVAPVGEITSPRAIRSWELFQ